MEKREFARRRKRLMDRVETGGIVIQPNAPERIRSRDRLLSLSRGQRFLLPLRYPEPESVAVLAPDREQGEYLLFCRERGRRSGKLARTALWPRGCV